MTKRVTGIGGVFFKCVNPDLIKEWYSTHLGINSDEYGSSFEWRKSDKPEEKGYTAWSPFKSDTKYFDPSPKEFMINYRVENLEELTGILKSEGVNVLDEIQSFEYGKFVHIIDPEGNKIELWEAHDDAFEKIAKAITG
jgi:predicted enzyme related to lactoylglutathione lyase